MRIILLDHSGSMGRPFSGKTEFAGRTRETEAATKLEAAKLELFRSIGSLASPTRIALFEFTSSASLIYEGMSNNHASIQSSLDSLVAEDGTDIAAALDKAVEYVGKLLDVPFVQMLVISDGLSDLVSSQTAAQRLAQQRAAVINVILIDPTDEGEEVARAIALNGEVYAVTSSGELTGWLTAITNEQEALARQFNMALEQYQREEDIVISKVSPEKRLSFTAAYPSVISAGSWYSLLVYLHLAHLHQAVADLIQSRGTQLGVKLSSSGVDSITPIEQGTWLRLTPRVDGVSFNPLSQEVAWLEDIQETIFRFRTEKEESERPFLGIVDVHCGPALIAQIPLSISILDNNSVLTPESWTQKR